MPPLSCIHRTIGGVGWVSPKLSSYIDTGAYIPDDEDLCLVLWIDVTISLRRAHDCSTGVGMIDRQQAGFTCSVGR